MNWRHYFFGFHGRVNRAKWWSLVLIWIGWGLVSWAVSSLFGRSGGTLWTMWWAVSCFVSLVLAFASLAVGAKRLHDRNKSAWWLLVFYALPSALMAVVFPGYVFGMLGIGSLLANGAADATAAAAAASPVRQLWWMSIVALVICIWALIELGCLPGAKGDNRYGADPLPGGHA